MWAATVVQVLQDLFYVLLHVLFYLWSLLKCFHSVSSRPAGFTAERTVQTEWQLSIERESLSATTGHASNRWRENYRQQWCGGVDNRYDVYDDATHWHEMSQYVCWSDLIGNMPCQIVPEQQNLLWMLGMSWRTTIQLKFHAQSTGGSPLLEHQGKNRRIVLCIVVVNFFVRPKS